MAGKGRTNSSSDAGPPGSRPAKAKALATANAGPNPDSTTSTCGPTKKRGPSGDGNEKAPKKHKVSRGDNEDPASDPEEIEDPSNGLDQKLPPISSVHEAFIDLVKKANGGLTRIADDGQLILQIATMCSGTEAPIFSLKMAREAFARLNPGKQFLRFSHVFSVEVDAFKQAYIDRNTEGSIVFRDVRDFVDPEATQAPTAMGGLAPIPTGIDMLVAGCSCVDFSTLNTKKKQEYDERTRKDKELTTLSETNSEKFTEAASALFNDVIEHIDELGESGQTFFSMLSYVRNHRPKVVMLENVMNAPWNQNCNVWFRYAGYAATFLRLDTKDFWIPQTRTRGYLVAVDRAFFGESAEKIVKAWTDEMKKLTRRASSPVTDWILPSTHSLAIRACQDDANKALNGRERDSKWTRSKVRHARVRRDENLGDTRSLTHWGSVVRHPIWDKMSPLYFASLNDRSRDCIEIWQLRALKTGIQVGSQRYTYDIRHKIRIFDLSQNIDRGITGSPFGISPCNTPRGDFYLSNQGRSLSGYESLALQGLPIHHLDLSRESQEQLRDLAGNAMSTTVVGAGLVAALIAIRDNCEDKGLKVLQVNSIDERLPIVTRPRPQFRQDLKRSPRFDIFGVVSFSIPSLIDVWKRCRRYCFCNGAARYSANKFRRCSVCATIRCRKCAGNPEHEFKPYKRTSELVLLEAVPHVIMSLFPSMINNLIDGDFDRNYPTAANSVLEVPQFAASIRRATFYYKEVRITEAVTICFSAKDKSAAYKLQAVVSQGGLSWYLYLDPWCELGLQALRSLKLSTTHLSHPVARAVIPEYGWRPTPLASAWEFWSFRPLLLQLDIVSPENKEYLDIGIVDLQELSKFPDHVRVDLCCIPGRYIHKPQCDSAEDSLHVGDKNNLYLFKDPTKTMSPENDCFVISKDCRPLEHYETREILIKFSKNFNVKELGTQKIDVTVEGVWLWPYRRGDISVSNHPSGFGGLKGLEVHAYGGSRITNEDHDTQVLAKFELVRHSQGDSCMVLPKYEHATQKSGDWITVERYDLPALYDLISPVNVKLAGTQLLGYMATLAQPENCARCAPSMPKPHWIRKETAQSKDKAQFELHHKYSEMTDYDSQLKERPLPFEVQVKVTSPKEKQPSSQYLLDGPQGQEDLKVVSVRYGINPIVLMHQALSYLPFINRTLNCPESRGQVTATMRTEVNAAANLNYKFTPFKKSLLSLSEREGRIAPVQQSGIFKGELSSLQSQSLAWMLQREKPRGYFVEQEIEEYLVPELRMRLVGCAERKVYRRGGVVADDVGYGKTVVSLALMGHQHAFDETESVSLRAARNDNCTHLRASLVLVPKHLVDQWAKEAKRFLQINEDEILTIKAASNLRIDTSRFQRAVIIIVSSAVLNEKKYCSALEQYAGSLSPPPHDSENNATKSASGRAFAAWYEETVLVVQDHIAQCRRALGQNGERRSADLETLRQKIRDRYAGLQTTYKAIIKDRYDDHTREGRMVSGVERERAESIKASLEDPFSGFMNLLESFSFSRVIYDEFSYSTSMTSLFFRNVTAQAKWVLSATPPTKNLAAICDIARLINVHVARPMELRIGLPKVTEGPKLEGMTKAETQLSYGKLASEKTVQERHSRAHKFLGHFATANPLDQEYFGFIKTEEHVIVCNMRVDETLRYLDLQSELQDNGLDVELLPRELRKLLPEGLEWRNNSGRTLAGQALILTASLTPTHVLARVEDLIQERKKLLDSAKSNLKSLSDKAIWVANRIVHNAGEIKVKSAENAVKDVCVLFEYILSEDFDYFSGYDGWKAVFGAIFSDCKRPADVLAHINPKKDLGSAESTLLENLDFHRKASWAEFFTLKENDLEKVTEHEATALLEDMQLHSNWEVKRLGRPKDDLKAALSDLMKADNSSRKGSEGYPTGETLEEKTKHYNGPTKTQIMLKELCRQRCIKFSASESKKGLADRLAKHDLGILSEDQYSDIAFRQLKSAKFPFFDEKIASRGATYTFTRYEAVDVALAMKSAIDLVIHLAKQVMIVENILKPEGERRCDNCGTQTGDLHLVPRCGHLLCHRHLADDRCGNANRNDLKGPSKCPSILVNRTRPLSTIHGHQRSLLTPTNTNGQATRVATNTDGPALSSKVQMIVDVIQSIPEGEKILLFGQYEAQLAELRRAFPLGDDKEEPKVRILKLNAAESAGSNFQYANHVMFASPLLVDLQQSFDAFMKQAVGRCMRHGQEKRVHIYHFVMANTIEVDMLELRKKCSVRVEPGQAEGILVYPPLDRSAEHEEDEEDEEDKKDKAVDAKADVNVSETMVRVNSNLSYDDIWRTMDETNWLTIAGLES